MPVVKNWYWFGAGVLQIAGAVASGGPWPLKVALGLVGLSNVLLSLV